MITVGFLPQNKVKKKEVQSGRYAWLPAATLILGVQANKQDRFTQQKKLADAHAQLNAWRLIKVLLEAHN